MDLLMSCGRFGDDQKSFLSTSMDSGRVGATLHLPADCHLLVQGLFDLVKFLR